MKYTLLSALLLLQLSLTTGCSETQRFLDVLRGIPIQSGFTTNRYKDIDEKDRKLLIVMVHGYNSGPEEAWTTFPEMIKEEKFTVFRRFNVVRYGYGSSACSNRFGISDRGDDLASLLKSKLLDYNGFIIIGHSMGGLIAMHALTSLALENNVDLQAVPVILMTFATPHLGVSGPEMLGPLGLFCRDPQAEGMTPYNKSLGDLRKIWDHFFTKQGDSSLSYTVFIKTYAGSDDTFVTPESACGRFLECERVDGNHAMVLKLHKDPDHDEHLTHTKIREQVKYLEQIVDSPAIQPVQSFSAEQESKFRSVEWKTSTQIQFINRLQKAVQIYWLDYEGKRVLYCSLQNHKSCLQHTYITHPWLVTDTYGTALSVYLPQEVFNKVILSP